MKSRLVRSLILMLLGVFLGLFSYQNCGNFQQGQRIQGSQGGGSWTDPCELLDFCSEDPKKILLDAQNDNPIKVSGRSKIDISGYCETGYYTTQVILFSINGGELESSDSSCDSIGRFHIQVPTQGTTLTSSIGTIDIKLVAYTSDGFLVENPSQAHSQRFDTIP